MQTLTLSQQRHAASIRYARTIRNKGAAHPDTIEAGREFGALKLAETLEIVRKYGLTELDLVSVVKDGRLAPSATAA